MYYENIQDRKDLRLKNKIMFKDDHEVGIRLVGLLCFPQLIYTWIVWSYIQRPIIWYFMLLLFFAHMITILCLFKVNVNYLDGLSFDDPKRRFWVKMLPLSTLSGGILWSLVPFLSTLLRGFNNDLFKKSMGQSVFCLIVSMVLTILWIQVYLGTAEYSVRAYPSQV